MILETKDVKSVFTKNFNMVFKKETGYTVTWGKTKDEDPDYCPGGPIIADFEISSVCDEGCAQCYKSNTVHGNNMSFEVFKNIFHKLPRTLTQIAFGIGNITACPDLKNIFDYCKNNDYQYIVPNVTINGSHMTEEWFDYLAKTCGAVAVSYYDLDKCFNSVKELTDRGMTQCNIHAILSEDTFSSCMDLIDKIQSDERLSKLNAVVFLMLKNKGRGKNLERISDKNYNVFIKKLFDSKIRFGFDSCGSGRLVNYGIPKEVEQFVEPCESGLFSMYCNTEGIFFPCSFTEGVEEWEHGIDLKNINDFISDVWENDRVKEWRKCLLGNCRNCPKYDI